MISRTSTKLIADAYAAHFQSAFAGGTNSTFGTIYKLKDEDAYNFLYLREYELWFLQIMARFITGQTTQKLVTAIMGIHTGETLVPATAELTYAARQAAGQPLLKRLAEDMIRHYEITPVRQI